MKHTKKLLFAMMIAGMSANAQTWINGTVPNVTTTTTGNCTIGGNTFIKGGILDMNTPADLGYRNITSNSTAYGLFISAANAWGGAAIQLSSNGSLGREGSIHYFTTGGVTNPGHVFYNYAGGSVFNKLMDIHNNGDVDVMGNLAVVGGSIDMYVPTDPGFRNITASSNGYGLFISGDKTWGGAAIEVSGNGHAGREGSIHYFSTGGVTNPGHVFYNYAGGSSFNKLMDIHNNGDLEVMNKAYVRGGLLDMYMPGDPGFRNVWGNSSAYGIGICANTNTANGAAMYLHGNTSGGFIQLFANGTGPTIGYDFNNFDGSTYNSRVRIYNDGAVVIGDYSIPRVSPGVVGGYNLYVQYGILAEHVRVASHTTSAWADFVFNSDYELMSLNNVEKYIKSNKHLPEIPSAAEVEKEGIDLQNMDAKLLQKIEELTLYVIQQQKRIEGLEKKIGKANK